MDYSVWEPFYNQILEEFHYSQRDDDESARWLDEIAKASQLCSEPDLAHLIEGDVTICGGGNNLERHLDEHVPMGLVISTGPATAALSKRGIRPDLLVTDLDGPVTEEIRANRNGTVSVILAHGDNKELVRRFVPQFIGPIVPTTQSRPFGTIRNYGGFTDGDRAVCLARHFGAKRITLLGFDFDVPGKKHGSDPKIKKAKLEWARKIIFQLNSADVVLIVPE
jgi:uncharacterized Rossmann fold enzyme